MFFSDLVANMGKNHRQRVHINQPTAVPPALVSTAPGGKTTAEVETAPTGGMTTCWVTGVPGTVAEMGGGSGLGRELLCIREGTFVSFCFRHGHSEEIVFGYGGE
jgi:hypothetical protein